MDKMPQQNGPSGSRSSSNDRALEQMASDLQTMRRQQSVNFYAPGIALIILVAFAFWFFGRP